MQTWTCNNFKGHYPVGVGAVVTAKTIEQACLKLEIELAEHGITQKVLPTQLVLFPTKNCHVRILADGNY